MNPNLLEKLHAWNPWWQGRDFPLPTARRAPYQDLLKDLKHKKIQILAGPRQTGKTTLLRQLLVDLHKSGVRPQDTLYLPLDAFADEFEAGALKLSHLVNAFSETIAKQPLAKGDKYLFLDEVHLYPQWNREIKVLYDQQWRLHFLVSGSASAVILKDAATALAGRSREHVILPLSFSEVCALRFPKFEKDSILRSLYLGRQLLSLLEGQSKGAKKQIEQITKDFSGFASVLRAELSTYLRQGGFPEPVLNRFSEETTDKHLQTILDQMIRRDFVEFFHVRDTKTLERIIRVIAQNTARILSERGLSSDLGVSINTVRNHIGFLEKAYVVFAAKVLSGSTLSQTRISEKLFFLDPGLRNSLVGFQLQDKGGLLESVVYVHLWSFFQKHRPAVDLLYWRSKEAEVDVVVRQGKSLIGIEVHSAQDDIRGLQLFLKEYPHAFGILVSDIDPATVTDKRVVVIPPHVFLQAS